MAEAAYLLEHFRARGIRMGMPQGTVTDRALRDFKKIDRRSSLELDSLRGLSAILVLVAHSFQIFVAPVNSSMYGMLGLIAQASVMLFFALSGFLITKSITNNYSHGFDVKKYCADRINRIIPPLLVSLAICIALWYMAPFAFPNGTRDFIYTSDFMAREGFYIDLESIIGTLFFLNGFIVKNISANAPLWSLPYEVWYYVAAGIVVSIRGKAGLIISAILMMLLGVLSKTFFLYSIVWFSGAAACIAHNKGANDRALSSVILYTFSSIAAVIGAYYLYKFTRVSSPSQIDMRIIALYNASIGIAFSSFIFRIAAGKSAFIKYFSGTARFSYTLYVIHFPILLFAYGASQPDVSDITRSLVASVIGIAACIAISMSIAGSVETSKIIKYRKLKEA
ncbi:acyltransferase family protein [Pseudomonas aeruginosa]|uniref:acyltransferase family protein n=1 Tax=Pseudomonas aeruginosa TaxID=287 RepID=UPI003003B2E4